MVDIVLVDWSVHGGYSVSRLECSWWIQCQQIGVFMVDIVLVDWSVHGGYSVSRLECSWWIQYQQIGVFMVDIVLVDWSVHGGYSVSRLECSRWIQCQQIGVEVLDCRLKKEKVTNRLPHYERIVFCVSACCVDPSLISKTFTKRSANH